MCKLSHVATWMGDFCSWNTWRLLSPSSCTLANECHVHCPFLRGASLWLYINCLIIINASWEAKKSPVVGFLWWCSRQKWDFSTMCFEGVSERHVNKFWPIIFFTFSFIPAILYYQTVYVHERLASGSVWQSPNIFILRQLWTELCVHCWPKGVLCAVDLVVWQLEVLSDCTRRVLNKLQHCRSSPPIHAIIDLVYHLTPNPFVGLLPWR